MPNSRNPRFVLYLLLDQNVSEEWVRHLESALATRRNFELVLFGESGNCAEFKQLSSLKLSDELPLSSSPSETDFQQKIFTYHKEKTPYSDLLVTRSGIFSAKIDCELFHKISAANPNIATVSPLNNYSKLFGLFEQNQSVLPPVLVNKILDRIKAKAPFESPFFNPDFVFWRSDALLRVLDSAGPNMGSMELAEVAGGLGYIHIVTPGVYVHDDTHQRDKLFKKIDNHALSTRIIRRHPLTGLRHEIKQLVDNVRTYESASPEPHKPVQLHVMHSWGGGLHRWVSDYHDADTRGENYALKSIGDWDAFGKRLSLYKHPSDDTPIRHWDLYHPIHATALAHLQYAEIIQEIVHDYGIDTILVSSLIGHAMDILDTGLETSLILHDYYPFCPAIYIHYQGICESCDKERLSQCQSKNPLNYLFQGVPTNQWLSIRRHYKNLVIQNRINLISPSESVGTYYKSLIPEFADLNFTCIPHGLPKQLLSTEKVKPRSGSRLKIVILGKLDTQKGLHLIRQLVKPLSKIADLVFLGCGDKGKPFARIKGVTVEETYEHDQLTHKLQDYAPDLGLLLPIWPETFSFTLNELMAHAVPTIVSAFGAPSDRIKDQETGFLVVPEAEQVVALVKKLSENREMLETVKNHLMSIEVRSTQQMVEDYHRFLNLDDSKNLNSYAMVCLSQTPPSPISNEASGLVYEKDFFYTMQQLKLTLIEMINKVPGMSVFTRNLLTICVKLWIELPLRLAKLYVRRK